MYKAGRANSEIVVVQSVKDIRTYSYPFALFVKHDHQIGDDGPMADRRVAQRYELSVPITVWLSDLDSVSINIGRTCAISTSSVYFILGCALRPGTAVGFVMTLPAELTGGTDVFIRGVGKVSRLDEQREEDFGIAVVFDRYEISTDAHSRS